VAPADRRAGAFAADLQRAVALERLLPGGLAHRRQRVAGDAGQGVEREFAGAALDRVDQPQRMRDGVVAADAGAHVLEFLVAGLGDVGRHLAFAAAVGTLLPGHHQQVARVRREAGVDDLDVVAEEHRGGGAGRVGLAPGVLLRALGLAALAVAAQGLERAQLLLAQGVGGRRRGRIALGPRAGDLGGGAVGAPMEPVVARAPEHAAVGGETDLRLGLGGAGELDQAAAGQVAYEHVTVADEGHAPALRVVGRIRRIQGGALGIRDPLQGAAGHRLAPSVAHRGAFALEQQLGLAAIPAPPGLFHRRADPVRLGHRLLEGEIAAGRGLGGARQGQGRQQQRQQAQCGPRGRLGHGQNRHMDWRRRVAVPSGAPHGWRSWVGALAAAAAGGDPVPLVRQRGLPQEPPSLMSAVIQPALPAVEDLPLVAGHPARVVVFDGSTRVTLGQFLAQARALAERLPEARCVAHLSEDRYRFLLGFCAAALRGQVALLPPSGAPQTLADVIQAHADGGAYRLGGECGMDVPGPETAAELAPANGPTPLVRRGDLAAIGYTSGSTGRPQAHSKTWGAFATGTGQNLAALADLWGDQQPQVVATVPSQHMYGMEMS